VYQLWYRSWCRAPFLSRLTDRGRGFGSTKSTKAMVRYDVLPYFVASPVASAGRICNGAWYGIAGEAIRIGLLLVPATRLP
jgi:hypothetical protein